ncbi:MAG: hypothetical protein ACLUOI_15415 [Eisenbergiella sp.]
MKVLTSRRYVQIDEEKGPIGCPASGAVTGENRKLHGFTDTYHGEMGRWSEEA